MSFLYPRTISIRRPGQVATSVVGDRGYSAQRGPQGAGAEAETVVFAGPLPASIQEGAQQRSKLDLPTDPRLPVWKIYVPKSAGIGKAAVKRGDIVVDDTGVRYQVAAPIWTSLGMEMRCLMLEV